MSRKPPYDTLDDLYAKIERLQRRLSGVIGYCAQEGCDGEPYDTIHKIATGEYDPVGSRPQSATERETADE